MGKIGVLFDIFCCSIFCWLGVARKKSRMRERERAVFGIWRLKMCEVRVGKRVVK